MFRALTRLRCALIVMICMALPWSAGAAMIDGLGCSYQGGEASATSNEDMGAMVDDMADMGPVQSGPASAVAAHENAHCDGHADAAAKCGCCHHCLGGSAALIALHADASWNQAAFSVRLAVTDSVPRGSLLTDVFRPPNAAPELGAA